MCGFPSLLGLVAGLANGVEGEASRVEAEALAIAGGAAGLVEDAEGAQLVTVVVFGHEDARLREPAICLIMAVVDSKFKVLIVLVILDFAPTRGGPGCGCLNANDAPFEVAARSGILEIGRS